MQRRAAIAVALVAVSRGWCGGGLRVWGRAGRALARILGMRAGARGGVYINEDLVIASLVHVRERGWRGVVKLVETFPDLLYPLSPERAKKLYLKMPWWTARAIARVYNRAYPSSRLARLYRRLRRARMTKRLEDRTVLLDEVVEWVAYACGILRREAERVVEEHIDDVMACMGDEECVKSVLLKACNASVQ